MNDDAPGPRAGAAAPRPPGATRPATDPAAVADILASIRSIVAEEGRRFESSPLRRPPSGEVLLLTPEMRIDAGEARAGARRAAGAGAAAAAGGDALADLVRAVLREEIEGEFGARVVERVRAIVQRERSEDRG